MPRSIMVGDPASMAIAPIVLPLYDPSAYPFEMADEIVFRGSNPDQEAFCTHIAPLRTRMNGARTTVRTIVSDDPAAVSSRFEAEGLGVQAQTRRAPQGGLNFYIGALMNIDGMFVNTERTKITTRYGTVPAAVHNIDVRYFRSAHSEHPVAVIESRRFELPDMPPAVDSEEFFRRTKEWEINIGITPLDTPLGGIDVVLRSLAIHGTLESYGEEAPGRLILPMVDLRNQPNLAWMEGLETADRSGRPVWCQGAQQENWFRLSDEGFVLSSGTAIAMVAACCGDQGPNLVIDSPFLLWVSVEDDPPAFAAYLPPSTWKDRGRLLKE